MLPMPFGSSRLARRAMNISADLLIGRLVDIAKKGVVG